MSIDLSTLKGAQRLLFAIPLKPVQGQRFQPTGFPGLGAATFQTAQGRSLLVESAQSMANRLELTIWDEAKQDIKEELKGLSHVVVKRNEAFLTDSILESHRINSPYLLEESKKTFFNQLKSDLGGLEEGPINRKLFAEKLLKYDVGSLLHGVFLAKKELAGGRLRIARAVSAFIEADGVQDAASGGVKNDHVNPQGVTKDGYGNVPFARDEFTAENITLYVNIDLGQIRGYGLGEPVEKLLILLALYKVRALVDNTLRLRTACDLEVDYRKAGISILATRPEGWVLPVFTELEQELKASITTVGSQMTITEALYNDVLKKGKDEDKLAATGDETSGD